MSGPTLLNALGYKNLCEAIVAPESKGYYDGAIYRTAQDLITMRFYDLPNLKRLPVHIPPEPKDCVNNEPLIMYLMIGMHSLGTEFGNAATALAHGDVNWASQFHKITHQSGKSWYETAWDSISGVGIEALKTLPSALISAAGPVGPALVGLSAAAEMFLPDNDLGSGLKSITGLSPAADIISMFK
jgi:hypothetical protein